MLNIPALAFIEISAGKKIPVLLAEHSGVCERTLRKPAWSGKTVNKIEQGLEKNLRKQLSKAKYSDKEIDLFSSNWPRTPYAGVIYGLQIPGKMEFPRTLEFAEKIDQISLNLSNAREQGRLEAFKRILLTSELLDQRYYVNVDDEWNSSADPEALNLTKSAQDWRDIDKPLGILVFNTLFSLMACWDIEFTQQYFHAFEPRSLFSLVLPKLDPAAGDLSEVTIAKRRGMFWLPVKRLIELIACLGYFQNKREWPDHVPKLSNLNESESRLVSWRDGTTNFRERDFCMMWQELCPDKISPNPLFVAATMWQIYLTDIGTNKTIHCVDDWYQGWWKAHFTKLASDLDLSSGEKGRWPTCFDAI